MSTVSVDRVSINGVIDPSQGVLDTINQLGSTSQAYIAWDSANGRWQPLFANVSGTPRQFNDDNMVGSITVTGSGITEQYNSIRATFAHRDLNGDRDEVMLVLDPNQRFPQELDNQLNINYTLLNDPIQVAYLAGIELKQSRANDIVQFNADYTNIDIEPGEVIALTSSVYGFDQKLYRVTVIEETEDDEIGILLRITAVEFDADIYSETGVNRFERNKDTGIIPSGNNICVQTRVIEAVAEEVNEAFNIDSSRETITQNISIVDVNEFAFSAAEVLSVFSAGSAGRKWNGSPPVPTTPALWTNFFYPFFVRTLTLDVRGCFADIDFTYPGYTSTVNVDGVDQTHIFPAKPQTLTSFPMPMRTDIFFRNTGQGLNDYVLLDTRYTSPQIGSFNKFTFEGIDAGSDLLIQFTPSAIPLVGYTSVVPETTAITQVYTDAVGDAIKVNSTAFTR